MSRQKSKNTLNEIKFDYAKLGQAYYNVLDVSSQNIEERIIENSNELGISQETIKKITEIVNSEIIRTKDWGFDIISKIVT